MRRESITIVLVPENREPMTIELSFRELLLALVLLLSLAGAATWSVINYRRMLAEYDSLQGTVERLESELASSEQRVAEIKGKLESQQGMIAVGDSSQNAVALPAGTGDGSVRIEQFAVQAAGRTLEVRFNLLNGAAQDRLLSGYLMILAEHESGDFGQFGKYPPFELGADQPLDYRLGDSYAIRRFKHVEARIQLPDDPARYPRLRILVFGEDGRIILYDRKQLEW